MPNTYYEGQFAQKRRDPWRWPRLAGLKWDLELNAVDGEVLRDHQDT